MENELSTLLKRLLKRTLASCILVLMCSVGSIAQQQLMKVTGIVTDAETKEPLPGVTVLVEGTKTGVITDVDGKYTINVTPGSTIDFSFIGYETQKIKIADKKTVNVKLKVTSIEMDEAVAIGYGVVRKSDLTGAIAQVNSASIAKTPVNSLDQALQGNAAGVLVITTSAEPGGDVTMRIRGGSSISGDNEPLIVIDNVPATNSALSMLNPNDIESMEVLKDAASTAIFGSRGANGVIMVTTKSGKAGKTKFTIDVKQGFQMPRRNLPMMDAKEFALYDNLSRLAWGVNSVKTFDVDTLNGTNYQNLLIHDMAHRQEYNLQVSGGAKETNYFVSGGYLNEKGLLSNSKTERMTLRSKVNTQLHKNVKLSVNTSLTRTVTQSIGGGSNGAILRTLMLNPLTSKDGTYKDGLFIDEETGEILSAQSETAKSMYGNNFTKKLNTEISGQLSWTIIKGLSLNINGGFKYTDARKYAYMPRKIFFKETDIDKNNTASREASDDIQWTNDNTLNYVRQLKKHALNFMIGQTWQCNQSEGFGISVRRFETDMFMWDNLAAGMYVDIPKSSKSQNTLLSFMGRFMYNYASKYYATFTMRADGSSRFGKDSKFGYFPSASVAWGISREDFMKDVTWLDNLKLRFSWGITGNDKIGQYQSMSLLSSTKVMINGNSYGGTQINRIGNPKLQWETTHQYNLGLDMGMLDYRVSFSVDAYLKKTFNLLYAYRLPQTTGYSTVMSNIGNIDNKGIEFELNSKNIVRAFKWTTSFNLGYNASKVTDLGGNDNVILNSVGNIISNDVTFLELGKPLGVFKGYKTSIYKNWKEIYADNAVWVEDPYNMKTIPGMMKYQDTNNDGVISEDDKVILGQAQPKLMGGFTNTFSYKNFELTVFFNGAWGNKVVNSNVVKLMRFKGGADNQVRYALDCFRPMNPTTGDPGYIGKYPVPTSNTANSYKYGRDYMSYLNDTWLENGAYLRLKSITLAYDFPQKLIRKIGMQGLRLAVSGINLLTFTKYTGYDPEMSSSYGSSNANMGIDQSSYPASKSVSLNLNINF